MDSQSEIILYQPDETVKVEVRLEDETVWLTQAQIVELFQSSKANISEHIKNIYEQEELEEASTVRDFRTVRQEGRRQVVRTLTYYNLDAIISIGFRVNSKRGILFRQWANKVLKEYLLKGYSVNRRLTSIEQRMDDKFMQHEMRLNAIDKKIDFFVRTSMPPVEGIFYDGQIFDAYKFVTELIKSARRSVIVIDNYVDETVLTMLDKRGDDLHEPHKQAIGIGPETAQRAVQGDRGQSVQEFSRQIFDNRPAKCLPHRGFLERPWQEVVCLFKA